MVFDGGAAFGKGFEQEDDSGRETGGLAYQRISKRSAPRSWGAGSWKKRTPAPGMLAAPALRKAGFTSTMWARGGGAGAGRGAAKAPAAAHKVQTATMACGVRRNGRPGAWNWSAMAGP